MSDQSADLHPERNEGDEINHAERAEKNPAGETIFRHLHMAAPATARQPREKCPVGGDKAVGPFGNIRERR